MYRGSDSNFGRTKAGRKVRSIELYRLEPLVSSFFDLRMDNVDTSAGTDPNYTQFLPSYHGICLFFWWITCNICEVLVIFVTKRGEIAC